MSGDVDPAEGVVRYSPFPDWRDVPPAELAGAACKLPVTAGSHVEFTGCRELTVVLSGGTDYAPNAAAHHRNHTWERLRARARDGEPDPG